MRLFRFRLYRLNLPLKPGTLALLGLGLLEMVLLGVKNPERLAIRNEKSPVSRGFSLAVNGGFWPKAVIASNYFTTTKTKTA